ncbi:MAG: two-component regulator propeller domain-containing protein [Pseudomonadota bacterium]
MAETFQVGPQAYVRALAHDSAAHTLWVGTSLGALAVNSTTGEIRNTYTRDSGLANEYVFAALVDKRGATWLGTNGGGVSRLQNQKWRTYFPLHGLADYWVYSFAEHPDGHVWIGTWAGVSVLDPASGQIQNFLKELVNEWVYGIAIDAQGRVWLATEGGVNMYDGKTWRAWTHQEGVGAPNIHNLPFSENTGLGTRTRHNLDVLVDGGASYNPNYVFCIRAAPDGKIWVGTWGGGVSVFDGTQWQNFTSADGLAGDIVYALTQAQDGAWWFGTDRGVTRFDGKQWTTLTKAQGLMDNHVYAVLAAGADVWVGTREGVAHLKNQ